MLFMWILSLNIFNHTNAPKKKHVLEMVRVPRWWFQTFFIFTPIWGRFPIWLIVSTGLKPPTRYIQVNSVELSPRSLVKRVSGCGPCCPPGTHRPRGNPTPPSWCLDTTRGKCHGISWRLFCLLMWNIMELKKTTFLYRKVFNLEWGLFSWN